MMRREKFQLFIHDDMEAEEISRPEVEVLLVLEGAVDIIVEQKTSHLETEDIFVVNSNKKHIIKTSGDNQLLMRLMINYQMACDTFHSQDVLFWCDSTLSENEHYKELRYLLKRLLKHKVETDNYQETFGFLADCYAILNYLSVNFMVKSSDLQNSEEGDRYEERLYQINSYINSNYDQPISMKELSEKLFLSNGYLSRFFKKNYGMSFANYLTKVRVFHAADELLYTDTPVTRVAYDCGFTSAALFNKVFKKEYGVTPTEFRKQAVQKERKEGETEKQKKLERRIEEKIIQEDLGGVHEEDVRVKTADGSFSVLNPEKMSFYWADTINFGAASNLLDSANREHLIILQSALNFKYVRFWSMFSQHFYIHPEQDVYDFSQIDSILDFILEQGMKPFIDLEQKVKAIRYEVGSMKIKDEESANEVFTLPQWEHMIQEFMRHLSNRYGQNMLDGWRIELWFREDIREDREEWENYLKKFEITWRVIKECNQRIEVGGYGIRMDYGSEQRLEFLKKWAQSPCQPDYISIMYYGYERGKDGRDIYAKRTTDDDCFIHELRKEKERLNAVGFGHLPVYICDWNLTPSVRNYINDTTFKGAYIVKNIIDVYGEVQSMGYGAGSDRQYAFYDTAELLFGGTGLITKEGILKPAAFALEFLNRLFPYFIGKDKNYLVSTDGHSNYGIVCHNQQILNYSYYLTSEPKMERENMWKYYEGRQRLQLRIRLQDVEDGQYRVKVYRISFIYGSVLSIWGDMGYENELSKNDIKYLRRICEPNMTIKKLVSVQGNLVIDEELQPNEITFIRVRKMN